jgi:hypothetical protein
VLGIQLVILSAVAATIDVTATLSALAIPAIGSSFSARTTFQVRPEQETTFLFPGGFTIPSDTPIGSQACVEMQ